MRDATASGWRRTATLLLAYLALAFAVMGANPFRAESITPLDALVRQHAFSWIAPDVEPRSGERSDILNALLPAWIDVREQIREGRIPLWNDKNAGGGTYLVPNTSMFTPAFAMFVAAPTPALGFHLAIVLNLALAGLGMHLFLRRHVSTAASVCGSVTFMFCGFHAAWLYWPHVHTAIWAPWLLLAIERCIAKPGMRGALGIGLATVLVALGGFPFVSEMILCMGGLYFLVSWIWNFQDPALRLRLPAWYATGSALGLLLAAPVLVELASWLAQFDLAYRDNRGSYLDATYVSRLLPPWAYRFKRVEQTMYVGLLMTFCAVGTILLSLVRPMRITRVQLFGLALLVATVGLVFGLWPMWMVGWFPGMSFNSWSRTIGLMDLAIIILGALTIDRLWKKARNAASGRSHVFLTALVALALVAQVGEQAHFFRRYNGPAPAAYFFPSLPAVDFVRERVGPFDYVIGDSSFGISGELGAYGLRDWFGHQIKTPAHKRALDKMVPQHRRSHTASGFRASEIKSDSPLLADFNIRYLIVNSQDSRTIGPARTKIHSRSPLPPQPGKPWIQYFDIESLEGLLLRGISVRMATYMEKGLQGSLELAVATASGKPVAGTAIDTRTIVDNQLAEFYFTAPVSLPHGRYRFSLNYKPLEHEARSLTAWMLPPGPGTTAPLLVGGSTQEGEMEYMLHIGDGIHGHYRRIHTVAGLSVLESMRAPKGPYFLPDVTVEAKPGASASVTIGHYSPEAFSLRYSGEEAGYVVVPQVLTRKWIVTVDGVPTTPALKHQVMPAVPVNGPATIEFRYQPWNLRALAGWVAALAGLLGLMTLLQQHFQRAAGRERDAR